MSGYYKDLINQSLSRTREATLSILGVNDENLRAHLTKQMSDEMGSEGCFLAPPIFEHTFGWQAGVQTFESLAGNLLSESVVNTLTNANNYSFDPQLKPYLHQLKSWETLLAREPKSVVVTTGTGSGKTECFMIPILQDLVSEHEKSQKPLVGVRALFLYPLNALINSQQERLDAWTQDYGQNIRFCLYNGNTKETEASVPKEQREKPNQVLSRERLRKEPAPILMTNATMLEYMLVRQEDEPIIRISREQDSLRWIVLDEAHTYVGSQAAELSLLLRRVVEAFGKKAHELRFVATSATIAGKDAEVRLQSYLASLAGVPDEQVVVIGGARQVPEILEGPKSLLPFDEVIKIDAGQTVSPKRYEILSSHPIALKVRQILISSEKPLSLNDLIDATTQFLKGASAADRQQELLGWIDLMTSTQKSEAEQPFLKLRAHLHQRMLHGLWSCADPSCHSKSEFLDSWPFGQVYVSQRSRCNCGSPVYELAFCDECKTPHLVAEDNNGTLKQVSPFSGDEFSLQEEPIDDDDDELPPTERRGACQVVVLAPKGGEAFTKQSLDISSLTVGALKAEKTLELHLAHDEKSECVECGEKGRYPGGFLRKCYLGAPFYVSNAVPTALEFCPTPQQNEIAKNNHAVQLPANGRKLITFTDSRQGTARMAIRMQQEAERSRLRGLVFSILRGRSAQANILQPEPDPELLAAADRLEGLGFLEDANNIRQRLQPNTPEIVIDWEVMVNELTQSPDIQYSILDYNRDVNPDAFYGASGAERLAQLLLLREFARRPKHQNSLETLGLIRVGYAGLDTVENLPDYWAQTQAPNVNNPQEREPLTLQDWKDFLKVALDFYVRENTFFRISDLERGWMGARFSSKELVAPSEQFQDAPRLKSWPLLIKGRQPSRLVKLLLSAIGLNPENAVDRDKVNLWLRAAWRALTEQYLLQSHGGNGYSLNRQSLNFSFPASAWVCPISNRLLDTTFRGITPYIPRGRVERSSLLCTSVKLPDYSCLGPEGEDEGPLQAIRNKVANNQEVAQLRKQNLWSDISDRVVEGGFYYRTAEHSAQQSAERLKIYEGLFKQSKINVLNCSTTMEMGVDIGGISAVIMNNVPPHPANYLQRAGRAGRRSEARALAYTLCKADPHNTRVFNNPKWAFTTAIPAPVITLDAEPLVQRHVNSYLLAAFLKKFALEQGDGSRLNTEWFFGVKEGAVHQFIDWLGSEADDEKPAIERIVRRTVLESAGFSQLTKACKEAIEGLAEIWQTEYKQINQQINSAENPKYKLALEHEKSRHEKNYLLKELATKAFLPGYGFPTNIVNLNTKNVEDFIHKQNRRGRDDREDNIFTFKEEPSRGLDIAIREYAPGAQVVIDGRVYRSAGIRMKSYHEGKGVTGQRFDLSWQCKACGTPGYQEYAFAHGNDVKCANCDADIRSQDKKRILRPTGFSTDFFESTSNDVTSQKFIPVERPLVHVDGSKIALPDPSCGYINQGQNGQVVIRSGGEHGKGFAVCMCCGRSESMTAQGELPNGLRPEQYHRAIGGFARGGKEKECSGESVMRDVYLGYKGRTHVVEWYLRNPSTGEWIPDNENGKVLAMTLAVAIRDAVADSLGIAGSEVGFATRPDRDVETGQRRTVIQVFDQAAGGAGFVLTSLQDVTGLLKSAFAKLECSSSCDSICSSCLASKDSRVEYEQLNRHLAIEWLQKTSFSKHLELPAPFNQCQGGKYWPHTPERFVRHWLNKSGQAVFIRLGGDPNEWDLTTPEFKRQITAWKLLDGCDVILALDTLDLPKEVKEELVALRHLGIAIKRFVGAGLPNGLLSPVQVQLKAGQKISLVTDSNHSVIPSSDWLQPTDMQTWITSEALPEWDLESVDVSGWAGQYNTARVLEITDELNGLATSLPERVPEYLDKVAPEFMQRLKSEPVVAVHYEDRYLRSPWSVVLLACFMKMIPSENLETVTVCSTLDRSPKPSKFIWDNFETEQCLEAAITHWLSAILNCKPKVQVATSVREVSHRRVLTLVQESGKQLKISFDQGMGYWEFQGEYPDRLFNFDAEAKGQVEQMLHAWKKGSLKNVARWPTNLALYENS